MYGTCGDCNESFHDQEDFYLHPCVQNEIKRLEAKRRKDDLVEDLILDEMVNEEDY